MKAFYILLFILGHGLTQAQNEEWLDPEPDYIPKKNTTQLKLIGFEPGEFEHKELISFARSVMRKIEDLESSGKKIQKIRITGYADGLSPRKLFTTKELPTDCLKYSYFEEGEEDIQLAILRACRFETLLNRLTKAENFNNYSNDQPSYYDEPTGGKEGAEHRKVEISIIYN